MKIEVHDLSPGSSESQVFFTSLDVAYVAPIDSCWGFRIHSCIYYRKDDTLSITVASDKYKIEAEIDNEKEDLEDFTFVWLKPRGYDRKSGISYWEFNQQQGIF